MLQNRKTEEISQIGCWFAKIVDGIKDTVYGFERLSLTLADGGVENEPIVTSGSRVSGI